MPPIDPVVPPGRLATPPHPELSLPTGHLLRPWREGGDGDALALLTAAQDPAIQQWNLFSVDSVADARRRIQRMHERRQAEQAAIWAIAEPGADSPAVGLIGWRELELAGGSAEIVYWLLPEARGRGVALAAVRRLSQWALDELGLHRLELCHSTANPASCRVAAKAGYALEGTMRSALLHADGWHDQHLHARIKGDA
ncbi:GNAT family N-acetyltransferase [Kitasatospora acidiphila]|uniref:GNAT family N-acetyltransferase n=1 Tax=Kitasatospora acidiphila TaxID=2567942 RepID=A0A540WD23_9ACTN|nr:GNAT family N-acetyltransferase [Kitasatospora acidiphila]TQF06926.1 GNAT family N-acetyltransferase [Kitasatospora acidiphila]